MLGASPPCPRKQPRGPGETHVQAWRAATIGLAYALRSIPVGTGYAFWVGIGAVGTAVHGMVVLGEAATLA